MWRNRPSQGYNGPNLNMNEEFDMDINSPSDTPAEEEETNKVTEAAAKKSTEAPKKRLSRREFAEKFCDERGWDLFNLSVDQLRELREQPEWLTSE